MKLLRIKLGVFGLSIQFARYIYLGSLTVKQCVFLVSKNPYKGIYINEGSLIKIHLI